MRGDWAVEWDEISQPIEGATCSDCRYIRSRGTECSYIASGMKHIRVKEIG
jgi:hypothetical protein